MSEFLDNCHLCGHEMGSRAPACPNCFARSDPAAREAIRLAEHEQWLATHQRETDRLLQARQKHRKTISAQKPVLVTIFLGYLVLLVAFAIVGRPVLALPATFMLGIAVAIWKSQIFNRP